MFWSVNTNASWRVPDKDITGKSVINAGLNRAPSRGSEVDSNKIWTQVVSWTPWKCMVDTGVNGIVSWLSSCVWITKMNFKAKCKQSLTVCKPVYTPTASIKLDGVTQLINYNRFFHPLLTSHLSRMWSWWCHWNYLISKFHNTGLTRL